MPFTACSKEALLRARTAFERNVPLDDVQLSSSAPAAPSLLFDGATLHGTLKLLGFDSLTHEHIEDVMMQVYVTQNRPATAPLLVGIDEVVEWMDTILALNHNHRHGASPPVPRIVTQTSLSVGTVETEGSQPESLLTPSVTTPVTPTPNVEALAHFMSAISNGVPAASPNPLPPPEVLFAQLEKQGLTEFLREVISTAVENPTLDVADCAIASLHSRAAKREHADDVVDRRGSNRSMRNVSSALESVIRSRSLSFASSLALQHIATSGDATMLVRGSAMFVDVCGYSQVAATLAVEGAHVISAVMNGFFKQVLCVIQCYGGDVIKFAGDCIMVLWSASSDVENTRAAVACAAAIQQQCSTNNDKAATASASLACHIGIAFGRMVSRIFSPKQSQARLFMPSHFYLLTGEPLSEASAACGSAGRGEIVIHQSAVEVLSADLASGAVSAVPQFFSAGSPPEPGLVVDDCEGSSSAVLFRVHEESSPGLEQWMSALANAQPPLKPTLPRSGTVSMATENQFLFMPPRIAEVLSSGMDPLFMAEMRKLVVLFIRHGEGGSDRDDDAVPGSSLDVEVWFDEVFHVLESFACDVVQVVHDVKGVYIVAAFNLYLMSNGSVDAAIQVCRALESKQLAANVGVATGKVFSGVMGSSDTACQWDIGGPACVRAARLMQHAADNGHFACFDDSVFHEAIDRSNLQQLEPAVLRGVAEPVEVYALLQTAVKGRASLFALEERVPSLHFYQSLCPHVHATAVREIQRLLQLHPPVPKTFQFLRESEEGANAEGSQNASAVAKTRSNVASILGVEGRSASRAASVSHGAGREGVRMVILTGTTGTGKFSVALNSLSAAHAIPIVHNCSERQVLMPLMLLTTVASWFACSKVASIQSAAAAAILALREHRHNEAFTAGLRLLQTVVADSPMEQRFAMIVRGAHFLDQNSVSFLGAVVHRLQAVEKLSVIVTCSALFGYPEPEKRFLALGHARSIRLEGIQDVEVDALIKHELKIPGDVDLLTFVCRKTNKNVECVVELVRYLWTQGCVVINNDGTARLRDRKRREVEAMPWGDISQTIQLKTVHVLDHLPPHLLMMCKIIAAITEQPLITAFFYSVNRVCEAMLHTTLDVQDIKLLDQLYLLKMCEHKCTSHKGTGELDAAVFLVPSMRDVVQMLLVPEQRAAINRICGDCYAETHPMDHPMQYLVRARHYLFAKELDKYVRDMKLGWGQLIQFRTDGSMKAGDIDTIQSRYFEWMQDVDPADAEDVLHGRPELLKMYRFRVGRVTAAKRSSLTQTAMLQASALQGAATSTLNATATTPMKQSAMLSSRGSLWSSDHNDSVTDIDGAYLEKRSQRMMQKLAQYRLPVMFAASRPALQRIVNCVQHIHEYAGDMGGCHEVVALHEVGTTVQQSSDATRNDGDADANALNPLLLLLEELTESVEEYFTVMRLSLRSAPEVILDKVDVAHLQLRTCVKAAMASVMGGAGPEVLTADAPAITVAEPSNAYGATFTAASDDNDAARRVAARVQQCLLSHTTEVIPALSSALTDADVWRQLAQNAYRLTQVIRRRKRFTGHCAVGEATLAISEHQNRIASGSMIVSLFEEIAQILQTYAGVSESLQECFCVGLEALYHGMLQPPSTFETLRRQTAVFFFTWLNCCAENMLF